MPTSIHIPPPLLSAIDKRARHLRISRNRLIVRALERELAEGSDWSPAFFERLRTVDHEVGAAAAELREAVIAARRSKGPPRL